MVLQTFPDNKKYRTQFQIYFEMFINNMYAAHFAHNISDKFQFVK